MATGTITLLWYVCCCAFVAFAVAIGFGLVLYGERKKRAGTRGAIQPPSGTSEPPLDPPEPPH